MQGSGCRTIKVTGKYNAECVQVTGVNYFLLLNIDFDLPACDTTDAIRQKSNHLFL